MFFLSRYLVCYALSTHCQLKHKLKLSRVERHVSNTVPFQVKKEPLIKNIAAHAHSEHKQSKKASIDKNGLNPKMLWYSSSGTITCTSIDELADMVKNSPPTKYTDSRVSFTGHCKGRRGEEHKNNKVRSQKMMNHMLLH